MKNFFLQLRGSRHFLYRSTEEKIIAVGEGSIDPCGDHVGNTTFGSLPQGLRDIVYDLRLREVPDGSRPSDGTADQTQTDKTKCKSTL